MRKWLGTLLVVMAVGLGCGLYFFGPTGPEVRVRVGEGRSLPGLAEELARKGVVESPKLFLLILRVSGRDRNVETGEYVFRERDHELRAALRLLEGPRGPLTVRVTVPEGLRIEEIAGRWARAGVDSAGFVALCRSREYIASLRDSFPFLPRGLGSLEGFLFPETYEIYEGQDPRSVIPLMLREFGRRWGPAQDSLARSRGLSLYQVLILASIVEREAKVDTERPIIAGVFLRRLRRGMPLAANPTLEYVLGKREGGWLSQRDLATPSPYNTYRRRGLPPTPICSPSWASISAVLHPAETPYLYFVATGDGGHLFAKTYQEHLANLRKVRAQ